MTARNSIQNTTGDPGILQYHPWKRAENSVVLRGIRTQLPCGCFMLVKSIGVVFWQVFLGCCFGFGLIGWYTGKLFRQMFWLTCCSASVGAEHTPVCDSHSWTISSKQPLDCAMEQVFSLVGLALAIAHWCVLYIKQHQASVSCSAYTGLYVCIYPCRYNKRNTADTNAHIIMRYTHTQHTQISVSCSAYTGLCVFVSIHISAYNKRNRHRHPHHNIYNTRMSLRWGAGMYTRSSHSC